MTRNDDGKPSLKRSLLTHLLCAVLGAVLCGVVVYFVMEKQDWNHWQLENRHRKGALAELAAETLARLRTGTVDDTIPYLEDTVDRYMVGVPMGDDYYELDDQCQSALATCKVYGMVQVVRAGGTRSPPQARAVSARRCAIA